MDAASVDAALPSHRPSGPATPFDPEAVPGGSVEGNPGSGWDTCAARTVGHVEFVASDGGQPAADGNVWLRFDARECTGAPAGCVLAGPSDAQLYFTLPEPRTLDGVASLELDMISFSPAVPTRGTLTIYAVDASCLTTRVLAAVPLAEMQLVPAWGARCVSLPATEISAIGIAVTGGDDYDVGIDALRFGARCE